MLSVISILTFHSLPEWLSSFDDIIKIVGLLGSFTPSCASVRSWLGGLLLCVWLGGLVALALVALAIARLVVVVVPLVGHGSVGSVRGLGRWLRVLGVGREGLA